jgi:hypothetical protein
LAAELVLDFRPVGCLHSSIAWQRAWSQGWISRFQQQVLASWVIEVAVELSPDGVVTENARDAVTSR